MLRGLPYKFNHAWLKDKEINELVRDFWILFENELQISKMKVVQRKLYELKLVV